jgi:hypothetical protein
MNNTQEHLALERSAAARKADGSLSMAEPMGHYSDVHAWVLMADPGAGKTDVFETLSQFEGGTYIKARDFIELDLPPHWAAPLFIDGLDEMTAGNAAGVTALGQIRTKLDKLGTPKFRISCREADWRGSSDSAALQRLVAQDSFLELHLAPLTRAQSVSLITHWQQLDQATATAFIREAEDHDLEGLLDNPQTLRMLFKAVSANANRWPTSKTQTYEMACAQLAREHNDDHLAANHHSALPDDKVLRTAGYLSAILLLSGKGTIAMQRQGEPQVGTVALPELPSSPDAPDINTCQAALQTRLFRGHGSGQFSPVHRTIGEYLGAQYLVSRIQAGLPINRVLALMLGLDAGVVPELRGMHAWLAALAPNNLRKELIDHDPLGAVLNGDVRNFDRTEKLYLLDALRSEATRHTYFRNQNWASKPFGALATKDMENDFRQQLQSADRSPAHLALVDCLLDALVNGDPMPALMPELERIVRDKSYWPTSRKEALNILAHHARNSNDWSTLTQLLDDIHADMVEDSEDELLGTLLFALYPSQLTAKEIWRYFKQPKSSHFIGTYWRFWHELSKDATALKNAPDLLDALLSSNTRLSAQHDRLGSTDIVGELLMRGVTEYGTAIEIPRLYGWLTLGLTTRHYCPLENQHKTALGQWFTEHPAIYKAVFEYGFQQHANSSEKGWTKLWWIYKVLYGAQEPSDAKDWYLTLAQSCVDDDLRKHLVQASYRFILNKNKTDEAIQLLEQWSSSHAEDADWVTDFLQCAYPPTEDQQEEIEYGNKTKERLTHESKQKVNFFREALPSFSSNLAHLGALIEIANAYLNFYSKSEEKVPNARLLELLNNDEDWVRIALHGLRHCLFRTDLPTAAQIIGLNLKGQRYNLAAPCLAAMELRYTESSASALELPLSTLETVAAFRLTNNFGNTPAWFKQLVVLRPIVLVNVMESLISLQIIAKKENVDGLYALAHDTDYVEVAKQIVPKLIAKFPIKTSKTQLQSLRLLITAMLRHLDIDTQKSLVAHKLSNTLMDVAQRVYWITAGLQVAPNLYLEPAEKFIAKSQLRIDHLFALIHEQEIENDFQIPSFVGSQAFLIELLAPKCSPSWSEGTGMVTPKMEMGRYVQGLISTLAGNPNDAALEALAALQQKPDLKQWSDHINRAVYDQRITRRKALFKPSSVAQVVSTLANLRPANAADLWALTVDHLKQLIHDIRNGSTNDYRQYWAGDTPKIEDDCRDALLSDLRRLLVKHGVNAEPEGRYADERRADIKVIATPHQIPIEIKREMHSDLWKAIPEQLIAKYGRELASDGYGIFLVFWFTGNLTAAPRDGGTKPKTPSQLQERLAATVPQELLHKIAVLVIDCSKQMQQ